MTAQFPKVGALTRLRHRGSILTDDQQGVCMSSEVESQRFVLNAVTATQVNTC